MEPIFGGNGRGKMHENFLHGSAVTSMLSPIHKQGYIGEISEKSTTELKELLERQEKMLKNRKFVDRLPDKGEKIKTFASNLRELISKRESNNNDDNPPPLEEPEIKQIDIQKMEMGDTVEQKHEAELKIIERGFNQLSVHEGPHYQVVVNAEERKHKSKFALNRPQKRSSSETNQTLVSLDPSPHVTHSTELTSASVHNPHPATLISVAECQSLYATQQKKLQETKAEQIAERVMRRIHGTLDHPEGRYRLKDDSRMQEDEEILDPDSMMQKDEEVLNPEQEFLDSID